jgi:uncharacterized SAM-binding protein YcdF (DUF218 family)
VADWPDLCERLKTGLATATPGSTRPQRLVSPRVGPARRWFRRLAWSFAVFTALLGAAWFFRAPLLTGLAKAWVVDEPLAKADAIVILGGRPDLRAIEAARLYQQGLAPRILYMDVKLSPSSEIGIIPSEREQTRRLLLSNNVPESALTAIGQAVASTYDESRAVRAWMDQTGLRAIIIPTDLAHTRRVRWLFRKELKGLQAQIEVHAIQPKEYGVSNWWRHEEGLIAFQNEFLKSVYYHVKY